MTWHIQSECFISEKHTNAKFKFVYDIDSWFGKFGTVGWYPTVGRVLDLKWGFYILGIFNFLQQPLSLLALITCTNHENSNRGRTQSNNLFPALTTIEKSKLLLGCRLWLCLIGQQFMSFSSSFFCDFPS